MIGQTIGPYRVVSELGAGGMGEVYRARDTRLDRDVALKVLPAAFTASPDRLARFEREAKVLAALNHPNIAQVYGFEDNAIAMELVEGPTLADRLASGPIPVDEALAIAAQIADALDLAHEKGIVHRDLKPANIKIASSGTVKVLDFGIARIVAPEEPSVTTTGLTRAGAVIGTWGYMAPEQLRGQPVDKRADIWSFGVVLYQMLTGERPRGSATAAAELEAVLAIGAGWDKIPGNVRRVLRYCLAEDPRDRLRDIGDFRRVLEEAPAVSSAPSGPSRRAFTGALATAIGATALGAWGWLRAPATRATEPVRFTAMLPAGARVSRAAVCAPSLALLPDGRTLIIAVTDNTGRRLYRRGIGELIATPIEGTSGAMSPFCSPDGRWIGFYADASLRYVPVEGGVPLNIAPAPGAPTGASWGSDDRIVFTHGWRSPLYAVPARGGRVETIAPLRPEEHDVYMRSPDLLPGGRQVVLEAVPHGVVAIDLETAHRVVLTPGRTPRYTGGRLIVADASTLMAAPFDVTNVTLTAPLAPIVEGVAREAGGARHYAVSPGGALAHAPEGGRRTLALSDLSGVEERILDEQPRINRPRFAPNGRRLAVAVASDTPASDDVWLYDTAGSGTGTKLTFDGGTAPAWSPDGSAVAFAGNPFWTRRQPPGLYTKNTDGRTEEKRLLEFGEFHRPIAWTAEQVLFELTTAEGEFWIERLAGGKRQRLARGINGRLSANGRLLAYVSDESGRDTVYVMALGEEAAPRWQIAEGNDPAWGPDGTGSPEIFYVNGTRLIAARLDVSAGVRVVSQRTVQESFAVPVYGDYDVSPDGQKIALVRPVDLTPGREVVVALDWLAPPRAAQEP